jgi:hypothetical protein
MNDDWREDESDVEFYSMHEHKKKLHPKSYINILLVPDISSILA